MLKLIRYVNEPKTIPYTCKKPYTCTVDFFTWCAECDRDGEHGYLHFGVLCGHKIDGASVPWPINILPAFHNWYGGTNKDLDGLGHDLLYLFEGKVDGLAKPLNYGECDDYYRGGKRCHGFGRGPAGIQDVFLNFAHTKRHWGRDEYEVKDRAALLWLPTDQLPIHTVYELKRKSVMMPCRTSL